MDIPTLKTKTFKESYKDEIELEIHLVVIKKQILNNTIRLKNQDMKILSI